MQACCTLLVTPAAQLVSCHFTTAAGAPSLSEMAASAQAATLQAIMAPNSQLMSCVLVLQQPQGTSIGEVAALAQEARGNITGEPLQLLLTPPRAPPAATPPRLPAGRAFPASSLLPTP